VFSALLVQQRMNIILCLIALHIMLSGTGSQTYFGVQPLHCLLFSILHDPKVIARFLRECFEHPGGSTVWTYPLVL